MPAHPRSSRPAAVAAWPVVLIALPVVGLVIPNTTQYVVAMGLGLGHGQDVALIRAAGLALPALLVAVPLAAVATRRIPARFVLAAGLCCALGGVLAVAAADAAWQAGAARIAQGAGAGMILPATLVLVWERRSPALTAAWAGALVAVPLTAMPPALRAVPSGDARAPDAWRDVLQPHPWFIATALAVAVAGAVLLRGADPAPGLHGPERAQLLPPLAPAACFAALAVITSYGWPPEAQLLVAALGFAALLGLALVGGRITGTGSPFGAPVVMLAAGLLTFPVAAPLTGLIGATHGPQDVPVPPFAGGAAAAVLGALWTVAAPPRRRGTVTTGLGLAVIAVLVSLTVDAASAQWMLLAPLALLGAGLGLALAASLREAGAGAALFGLTLYLPAVLTGQIAVSSLQSLRLRGLGLITTREQLVYGLTAGYRSWLIVAGIAAMLLLGAVSRAAPAPAPGDPGRLRAQQ